MIRQIFRYIFRLKPALPYLTKTYSFPPWPNTDISQCGNVNWNYEPRKG